MASLWIGSQLLIEQPTSPMWRFADPTTATVIYKGPFSLCLSSAPLKGAYGSGDYAGLIVSESTVTRDRGGIGTLTIVYEGLRAGDTQVPADEPEVNLVRHDFALERHPLFIGLTPELLQAARGYVDAKSDLEVQEFSWVLVEENSSAELLQKILTYMDKYERGMEKFALWVPEYKLTTYWITEPYQETGGYPEDPPGTPTAPLGWEWLRAGDSLSWNGTHWKLTSSWIAAPLWDPEIYPVFA
jgi:hypothetical protein